MILCSCVRVSKLHAWERASSLFVENFILKKKCQQCNGVHIQIHRNNTHTAITSAKGAAWHYTILHVTLRHGN